MNVIDGRQSSGTDLPSLSGVGSGVAQGQQHYSARTEEIHSYRWRQKSREIGLDLNSW